MAVRTNWAEIHSAWTQIIDSEYLYFGDAKDVSLRWTGSLFEMLPLTDDTGAFNIGNGTKDFDVKVFLGNTTHYGLFDVGNQRLDLQGTSMHLRLGTFASATSGSGVAMTAALSQALQVYVDDGNAAIASSVLTRGGRFRNLQVYTGGNREQEAVGLIGQIVSVAGTNRHNMAGLMGSYEAQTSLTVDGQASSTDPWIQAGVIGRVGVGTAITTLNANGILAGLAAMSNTASFSANNGIYTGLYVGRWGSNADWGYGIYLENVDVGIQFAHTLTPDANRTNRAIGIGSRATEKDITMAAAATQHLDPIQANLNIIGSNPSGSSTLNTFYALITHDTTDMSNMRLKNSDWNIVVGKDVLDVYCYQGEVDFNAAGIAVGGEAAVMGLTLDAGANAVTGNLWGEIIVTQGAGLPSSSAGLFLSHRTGTLGHSLYIEANSGATITDCIYINEAGTITNFLKFAATSSVIVAETGALPGTATHKIKCDVGGVAFYLIGVADF